MYELKNALRRFRDDESATATMELVIVFPLLLLVFIAAFETAMILTRQIMLERTLDMAVRVLRLTRGELTDADEVRNAMCSNTSLLPNCETLLSIDLYVIDDDTYDMPSNDEICADRGNDIVIAPSNEFSPGSNDSFLLVRTCLIVDRILPISGWGLNLARDDSGGMHMMASTIFVNERN
ncbi:TadE/TadG family type IV pilus assembly protein [Hasllibacter sp. MH4015]|uniref:TadE/TadG family type IV pilus assembly protein n=1 Tax=Hasllibacter sp. MH4015 TaxID=2854029 RepID=UPI001CD7348D|nr:TadE family protein [Hasllibacter sp. MH4015]